MPFLIITLINFRKKAKENFRKIRECDSRMNLTVQENIEAVRLVRSFTNEALEKAKFDELTAKYGAVDTLVLPETVAVAAE